MPPHCMFFFHGETAGKIRWEDFLQFRGHRQPPKNIYNIYIYIPAPSKGWCLNPKGLLSGTPCHPFGTPWRVQVYIHRNERIDGATPLPSWVAICTRGHDKPRRSWEWRLTLILSRWYICGLWAVSCCFVAENPPKKSLKSLKFNFLNVSPKKMQHPQKNEQLCPSIKMINGCVFWESVLMEFSHPYRRAILTISHRIHV